MMQKTLSKGELRRKEILEALQLTGQISIADIIDRFGCSEATARRDLVLLSEHEGVIRSIGGARYDRSANMEKSFREKEERLLSEKIAIAEAAASFVEDGDVVGLTGGTTTFLIAKALKQKRAVTIVTNAVNIAMELAEQDNIQIVLTGGVMRMKNYELCGPLAEGVVNQLNIGKMFVGINGISLDQGLTTYSESEAQIARLMIRRSTQVYAVFDHTKVQKTALFSIAPLENLEACITDRRLPQDLERYLQKTNIHYVAACERSK